MSLLTVLRHFADPKPDEPIVASPIRNEQALAMVIDDDPGMRSLMTLSLQQVGYQVVAVANATEAILCAQNLARIDLAVVDLELHGLHGAAVVSSLRSLSGYMPVVYVSELTEGTVGVADPVLRKPFLCGAWLNAVAHVVGVLPRDKGILAA
jgi:CheY-like chemotaxis protein